MSFHYENDDLGVCDGCCEQKLTQKGPQETQFCQDCTDLPWDLDPIVTAPGQSLIDTVEAARQVQIPGPFTLGWAVLVGWFFVVVTLGLWGWSKT